MTDDLPPEGSLDRAIQRLDRALLVLETRLAERPAAMGRDSGDLFADDGAANRERQRLAAELNAARAREKALEEVAAEASAALGRAAAEVRAALAAGEH